MINKEIIIIILVTDVVGLCYRGILGDIFKENVGCTQQRDIDSLLPWKVWAWGRYMNSYIKKYRIRYRILQFYYHISIVISTILLFYIIIPISQSPNIESGIEGFTYLYTITLIAAVYFIPWKFLGKTTIWRRHRSRHIHFVKHVNDFRRRIKSGTRYHPKGIACFAKKFSRNFKAEQSTCSYLS